MNAPNLTTLMLTALRTGRVGLTIPAQVYGANRITNGGFTAWSGGSPTGGWAEVGNSGGDPDIYETAPNGSAGTGAATWNMTATGTALQLRYANAYEVGKYYETVVPMTAYTSGRMDVTYGGTGAPAPALSAVRTSRQLARATGTELRMQTGGATPRLWTISGLSVNELTVSAQRSAPSASFRLTQLYTLPASPGQGDAIWLTFRINNANGVTDPAAGNYLLAILEYSTSLQWNVNCYVVTNHTRGASQGSATNIGSTIGLRVNANGNSITMETLTGSTWTQRGLTMTISTYNTATGYTVLAGSQFTMGVQTREAAV